MGVKKKTVFTAVLESTKGTLEADSATDAIGLVDFSINPELEQIAREVMNGSFTMLEPLVGKQNASFEVTVELKSSGVAGTAPECACLLETAWGVERTAVGGTVKATPTPTATAFTVVDDGSAADLEIGDPILVDVSGTYEQTWVTAATPGTGEIAIECVDLSGAPATSATVEGSVVYKLVSDAGKSVSARFYLDGDIKITFRGAQGNFKIADFGVGTSPKAVFSFEALEWTIEDVAIGFTPSIDKLLKPPVVLGASLQLDKGSGMAEEYVRNLEFDLGMGTARNEAIQAESGTHSLEFSGRSCTGSINPYMSDSAHFAAWKAMTSAVLQAKLADKLTLPNVIALRLPRILRTGVSLEDVNGTWANGISFGCYGDDDAEAYLGFLKTPA